MASKCQHFKLRGFQFHLLKWLKIGHFKFKVLAFWSRWRYQIQIIKIKYWNTSGSGFPPSFPPSGILAFYRRNRQNCIFCNTVYVHVSLRRCCFGLETRVIIQISTHSNFWNPSIYNKIRWFAGLMGQTIRRPCVWCPKYYFFS